MSRTYYAVIEDYGDRALTGPIAFSSYDLQEVYDWAEQENYHSASIVQVEVGRRTIIEGAEREED